jgi:hypothetical protein
MPDPAPSPRIARLVWRRTLRTASSERLLAVEPLADGDLDVAAADLHFLEGGAVAGTVSILADARLSEDEVAELLLRIDEDFLPGANVDGVSGEARVTFTVVVASSVANFESAPDGR